VSSARTRASPVARSPRRKAPGPRKKVAGPGARSRTIRAHSTRDRILDAAEALFAMRGFHCVSIRDITKDAGVQLALANYHFGSKQQLYASVIGRRGSVHAARMQKYLDEVIAAAADGIPTTERVTWAFCASIFEPLIGGGEGWRRYIRLLAWAAESQQTQRFVEPMNRVFDPVLYSYIRALRHSNPRMSAADLYAGYYFLQALTVHVVAATGGIDRLSQGGLKSTDFKGLLPRLVRYATAGFESLTAEPAPARRSRQKAGRTGSRPSQPAAATAISAK
jgi:AcrR family transcriptional regulator